MRLPLAFIWFVWSAALMVLVLRAALTYLSRSIKSG